MSPRVPASCPAGFEGRYTVQPGDTMFLIAQRFGVSLDDLIAANPHISDPNLIFPGDVLCVPGLVLPCCTVLTAQVTLPQGSSAGVVAHINTAGNHSVSFVATLPPPAHFGAFNSYRGSVTIPSVGTFNVRLRSTSETPPTWAATANLPSGVRLTPDTVVRIRPLNTATSATGSIIFKGTLKCCCPACP